MTRKRRNYTAGEKVAILGRHLVENVPVSDPCDDLDQNSNVFYGWQKQFFRKWGGGFPMEGEEEQHLAIRLPSQKFHPGCRQRGAVLKR